MTEPMRETSRPHMRKQMERLRNLKKGVGSQCHGRRVSVWRWEQAVAQCVGTELDKRGTGPDGVALKDRWTKQMMADRSVFDFE